MLPFDVQTGWVFRADHWPDDINDLYKRRGYPLQAGSVGEPAVPPLQAWVQEITSRKKEGKPRCTTPPKASSRSQRSGHRLRPRRGDKRHSLRCAWTRCGIDEKGENRACNSRAMCGLQFCGIRHAVLWFPRKQLLNCVASSTCTMFRVSDTHAFTSIFLQYNQLWTHVLSDTGCCSMSVGV